VLLLRRTVARDMPDAAMSARLRTRTTAEWRRLEQQSRLQVQRKLPAKSNWWDSFRLQSIFGRQRRLALSLAVVMLVVVVGIVVLAPGLDAPLTGTAGTLDNSAPLFILLGIVVVGGLIWFFRSKR
jgi:hypothetical protein